MLLVTRDTVTFSGADDAEHRQFSIQKLIPDNGIVLKPVECDGAVGHQGHCVHSPGQLILNKENSV